MCKKLIEKLWIEETTFDSYASGVWTSDAWWSEVTLDGWESSEVFPSDSWWSGVRSGVVASEGWQRWKTSESDEKLSLHEEGRNTKNDDSQRAQSSKEVWIN